MPTLQEGLSYQYTNGKLTFTTCSKPIESLDLSASVPEGEVTEVSIRFQSTGAAGGRFFAIKQLVLPKTLKVFPEFDFPFAAVKQLVVPASCKKIPAKAFCGWKRLENIVLPENLTEIKDETFYGCTALKTVQLPHSVCKIGKSAFRGCKSLQRIVIPDGVREIQENTFSGCQKLVEVRFPTELKHICKNAFKGCPNLLRADLPSQTVWEKTSFLPAVKIFVNGVEHIPAPEEFHIRLSNVTLHDVDTKEIRSHLQDGQTVEVHSVIHHFSPRLEVMTLEGEHVGFLTANAVQKEPKLRKIPMGEAFHAKVRFLQDQKIEIVFSENEPRYTTPFQDHIKRLNWLRKPLAETELPLEKAVYTTTLNADFYQIVCEHDGFLQQKEYAAAFSEQEASRLYKGNSNWEEYGEDASLFSSCNISSTLLEHLPLGTEFQVKIDTTYIQVDNLSIGYMHAGGGPDYAYPVPAFIMFYKGIRVANIPLMFDKSDQKEGYRIFLAFWKWCQNPTLQPRAWLVDVMQGTDSWDPEMCRFCIGFFPGGNAPDQTLDLGLALAYENGNCELQMPVQQLMETFANADEINLSNSNYSAESTVWLRTNKKSQMLTAALYPGIPCRNDFPQKTEWYTLEQLENGAYIKKPPLPYRLLRSGKAEIPIVVAGAHLPERKALCLSLKMGQPLCLEREPENPYDPNAIGIRTEDHQMCGYVPADQARWISPLVDAGIIQFGRVFAAEIDSFVCRSPLVIGAVVQWDAKKYVLMENQEWPDIPFVLLTKGEPDRKVGLLEQYRAFSDCWEEYKEFCDVLLKAEEKSPEK